MQKKKWQHWVWFLISFPLGACGGRSVIPSLTDPGIPAQAHAEGSGGSGSPSTSGLGREALPFKNAGVECRSQNPSKLCLALKYVVFEDKKGKPAVPEKNVFTVLDTINRIWDKCGIRFQIDQLLLVDPEPYQLSYHTSENHELDQIRRTFQDSSSLLVVTTGKWDRTGSIGGTGANAWTSMPGDLIYGAVLEAPVGEDANVVAHELGHYLNLDHVSNPSALMNPLIYDYSTQLTSSECGSAFAATQEFWKQMLR